MRLEGRNSVNLVEISDFKEHSDSHLSIKKSSRKRKQNSCTPDFKKKLRRFERLSEDEEGAKMAGGKPEGKKDELTDAEKQKPMMKGDKVELFGKLRVHWLSLIHI